jgi:hypothetical protein
MWGQISGLVVWRGVSFPEIFDMICISEIPGDIKNSTSIAVVSGFVLTHSPQDAVDDHAYEMYG